jgi:chromosome segregation ATPase
VIIRLSFAAMAFAALAGCASDPAPIEQMKLTDQALDQARAVGATGELSELQTAEAKYAQARAAMDNRAFREARMKAEQAELDARLAEAKVLTQKGREQVDQLNTRLNRLRKQLGEAQ